MASRRGLHLLIRHGTSLSSLKPPRTLPMLHNLTLSETFLHPQNPDSRFYHFLCDLEPSCDARNPCARHFSSRGRNDDDDDGEYDVVGEEDDDEDESSEGEVDDDDDDDDDDVIGASNPNASRTYSAEEKEEEAARIGYKVFGPLDRSERAFKPYEPVFAVVQIGSHQFKVSNGDVIYTEKLKFCEVNDKLLLNKVLLMGSSNQTIVGRPILPEASVYAVVEEHALDAKVIIFKKKRRKNYRRTKGHRQELTRLRIIDIQGIEKPELTVAAKPEPDQTKAAKPGKSDGKKQKQEPVAA